ncbi:hypothetical protein VNI00_012123 [Paramarasmius palmivorus]|uniref:F-box domain-containing protein n=1 Tax=Paramarasmius palmivorus TaxID=297713 RepID=A0AAW0C4M5_9AGAR
MSRIIENQQLLNSLLPINRLPNELLSKIFIERCSELKEPIIRDPDYEIPREGWLSLTHVCSHWRRVALATPSLWFSPDFRFPDLSLAMLERSKFAPLHIETYWYHLSEKGRFAVSEALKHVGHIETLKLRYHDEDSEKGVIKGLSALAEPAPMLRSLEVSRSIVHNPGHGCVTIPATFLGNHTPNITHLRLDGSFFPWDSTFYDNIPSLTCLYLSLTPYEHLSPSRTRLLDILRKCPALKKLQLRNAIPMPDVSSTAPVVLPNLELLSLSASLTFCVDFLDYIMFPDTATVEFKHCTLDSASGDEIQLLAPVLARILPRMRMRVEQLDIGVDDFDVERGFFVLKAWPWDSQHDPHKEECCFSGAHIIGSESPPRLYLGLYWNEEMQLSTDDVLQTILPWFELEDLRELNIKSKYADDAISSETVYRFFASLAKLRTFNMEGYTLPNVVELLNRSIEVNGETSSKGTMAFPALESIYVGDYDFDEDLGIWALLFEACRCRKEYDEKLALHSIRMFNCRRSGNEEELERALGEKWILDFEAFYDEDDDEDSEPEEEDSDDGNMDVDESDA